MKKTLCAATVLLLLTGVAALGQEPPRYLSIFTGHTHLGHQPQYEAAVKELWAALNKQGGDFPVFASQSLSSPGDYGFVIAMANMAAADAQNATFEKLLGANGAILAELGKHSKGNESAIIAIRADLSYRPDNPRIADGEAGFARVTFLYPHPAHVPEVEAALLEFAALSKKSGIRDGYGVYTDAVGGEGPVYTIRSVAKSEVDYYETAAKNAEAMGEEAAALRAKVGPMLRKIEFSASVPRPDLGYTP